MRQLFAAVEGTPLELPVKLAAYLGLRRSEICGLRWRSVDLEAGVISVQEARVEVGGQVLGKVPKTRTSLRRLGIGGLRDLQTLLRKTRDAHPNALPGDFVILGPDGQPPQPDQLTRDLQPVIRRAGLPHITLHGLRHSFASVANSQGVPMFDISRTLGHSSLAVTSNIYTHLFDETEARTLTAVAQAIDDGAPSRR
jgi:integrase